MKLKHALLIITGSLFASCSQKQVEERDTYPQDLQSTIQGTWKMVSAKHVVQGDTTEKYSADQLEGIKIIGDTHFSFFQHDIKQGEDSSGYFSAGAGKYVLEGNKYTEYLEYCTGRAWEGHKFDFTVAVSGDSLIQTGVERMPSLGVDRTIIETYVRATDENTPVPVSSRFDEEEISWFTKKGSGSIVGSAKFRARNSRVHFGDQFVVELMPVGGYTEERLSKIYGNPDAGSVYIQDGVPRFIPDPEQYHATIKTTCDANGNFEFKNLPKGEYYAIAFMIWDEQKDDKSQKAGGGIMRRVNLSDGGKVTLEMVNF